MRQKNCRHKCKNEQKLKTRIAIKNGAVKRNVGVNNITFSLLINNFKCYFYLTNISFSPKKFSYSSSSFLHKLRTQIFLSNW